MDKQEFVAFLIGRGIDTLSIMDYETYYCTGPSFEKVYHYTLSSMTTESYIRDPRFRAQMLAITNSSAMPTIICNPNENDNAEKSDAFWQSTLDKFPWERMATLAHNNYFDGGINGLRYNKHPALYLDTLSMARMVYGADVPKSLAALASMLGLGEKGHALSLANGRYLLDDYTITQMEPYCIQDAVLCKKLFFHLLQYFTPKHLLVIDFYIRMFTRPRLIGDSAAMREYANGLVTSQDDLLLSLGFGRDVDLIRKQLRKNDIFASQLIYYGVDPPLKWSKPTKKNPDKEPELIYAFAKTDPGMAELLEHEDERVSAMAHARLSLNSTNELGKATRMSEMAERGLCCMPIQAFGAHTGRGSGMDKLNVQNMGRKSPLKKYLLAPEGYVIVGGDSGQIQARLSAFVAMQDDLVQDFGKQDRKELQYDDLYCMFGSEEIYGRTITKADFEERFVSKGTVLGLGFNMGYKKYQTNTRNQYYNLTGKELEISDIDAQRIVNAYRRRYSRIKDVWEALTKALHALVEGDYSYTVGRPGLLTLCNRGIQLPDGTVLKYPGITRRPKEDGKGFDFVFKKNRSQWEYTYGGKVLENIAQALEQLIMNDKTIKIIQETKCELILQEHDCVYFLVHKSIVDDFVPYFRYIMSQSESWYSEMPLATDVGIGHDLASAKP